MNHFAASGGLRAAIERRMETAAAWLGWHPNFPYSAVGNWIDSRPDARIVERSELRADETVHAAQDREGGRTLNSPRRGRISAPLVSSGHRTYVRAWARFCGPFRNGSHCKIKKYVGARESAVHERREARAAALPTREEVIAYIGGAPAPNGERAPARVTKRDIARAFGVKGEAKAELKLLIKDLQAEGAVARGRKALTVEGRLPSLVVADIAELDRDGELIAKPVEWTGDDAARRAFSCAVPRETRPRAGPGRRGAGVDAGRVRPRRRPEGARLFRPGGQDPRQDEGARLRRLSRRGGRIGTRAPGREARGGRANFSCPRAWPAKRKDGDLVAIEPLREGRLGLPPARVVETDRFGQVRARGEPHRARDASYSACLFARGAEGGRRRAARSAERPARGLARAAARHDRSARRQGPRRRRPRRARFRS